MAGFPYLVVLPAELVLLWFTLGAWPPLWARVASSSVVLLVVAAVMLLLDPWEPPWAGPSSRDVFEHRGSRTCR